MAEEKKYSVIFSDNYSHDGLFKSGQQAELTQEQYDAAKSLTVGWNQSRKADGTPELPLITDVKETKTEVKPKP